MTSTFVIFMGNFAECVRTRDSYYFRGPTGNDATAEDPLVISKFLNQETFSMGQLIIRPLEAKDSQYVNCTMVNKMLSLTFKCVNLHFTSNKYKAILNTWMSIQNTKLLITSWVLSKFIVGMSFPGVLCYVWETCSRNPSNHAFIRIGRFILCSTR